MGNIKVILNEIKRLEEALIFSSNPAEEGEITAAIENNIRGVLALLSVKRLETLNKVDKIDSLIRRLNKRLNRI